MVRGLPGVKKDCVVAKPPLSDIERALQESEQRFRAIFDQAAVGISQVDLQGRWLLVNQKLCAIVGYTEEELLARTFQDITHPDDLETDLAYVSQLLAGTHNNYTMEKRYVRKDGEVVWINLSVSIVRDGAGQPAYFVSIIEDINLRKQIERELRASEERYRVLVDSVPQMMWLNRIDGRIAFFNQHVYEYTGRSEAEMVDGGWLQSVHPEDQAAVTQQHAAAIEAGAAYEFEARFKHRDGSYCWHMAEVVPLRNPAGDISGWLGTATEIDARKRAEEALSFLAEASATLSASLEYEATLQTVAELAVPRVADYCLIDIVEDDGQINRVAAVHRDPAKQQLIQESHLYLPQARAHSPLLRVLDTAQPALIPVVTEQSIRSVAVSDAHLRHIQALDPRSVIIVPMLVRGRAIGAIWLVIVDPQRKYDHADLALAENLANRAAQAVDNARLYRTAQAAVREREALLSIAAHELKNPLTALAGQTALLQRRTAREGSLGERDARSIRLIQEQAERLGAMLDALLDVSRLETGRLQLARQPLDAAALVRRVTEEVRLSLQLTGDQHHLVVQVPEQRMSIIGDALRLEQVVRNVIGNAVKYSHADTVICVTATQCDNTLLIMVQDQGIGIPPHALPRLFDRFYRVESAASQAPGLGIGLYVVKEIVAQHGGTVSVESVENQGSTFKIYLPLQNADPPSSAVSAGDVETG